MKTMPKLWIGIFVLIILSPLGLILPRYFNSGGAWGEWGSGEIQKLIGYIPKGLGRLADLWHAPVPDYAFKGCVEKGLAHSSLAYIASGILGVSVIIIVILVVGKILTKNKP